MTIPITPTPTSGVSFSQIRAEIRDGSNNPVAIPGAIPINNSQIRRFAFNAGPLTAAQAKPIANTRGVTFAPLSISVDTVSYNIRSAMSAAGWSVSYRGIANLQIGAVTVGSPSVSGAALSTTNNPWPSTSEVFITLASGGVIHGKGGPGGDGGSAVGPVTPSAQWAAGGAGTDAGDAIFIGSAAPPIVTIINNGIIAGGGGGGGGGNGRRVFPAVSGGGGGGGGRTGVQSPSLGGAGGSSTPATPTGVPQPGQAGQGGNSTSAGTGGQNTPQPAPTRAGIGGNGGGRGQAGQSGSQGGLPGTQGPGAGAGGLAGYSINGFTYVASLTGTGQLLGPTV